MSYILILEIEITELNLKFFFCYFIVIKVTKFYIITFDCDTSSFQVYCVRLVKYVNWHVQNTRNLLKSTLSLIFSR